MTDIIPQSILNKVSKDKFVMILDLPPILKGLNSNTNRANALVNLDKLQFSVAGTFVPAIKVPSESMGVWGQQYKVSSFSRPAYNPISVSFSIDNNFDNYWVLWKWLNILNDRRAGGADEHLAQFTETKGKPFPNRSVQGSPTYKEIKMENLYTDYQTTITVFGMREYNEKVVRFDYFNSFITDLSEIKYDYRDPAQIECSFTFDFNQIDIVLLDP